jgi:hypothetical protein
MDLAIQAYFNESANSFIALPCSDAVIKENRLKAELRTETSPTPRALYRSTIGS